MPPAGLDNLKHLVVLMMENRSFDHMLASLQAINPNVDGLPATYYKPETTGKEIKPAAKAKYQGQLDPDPHHHFAPVHEQIFNGTPAAEMRGFVRSYFQQRKDVKHSHK